MNLCQTKERNFFFGGEGGGGRPGSLSKIFHYRAQE